MERGRANSGESGPRYHPGGYAVADSIGYHPCQC